MNENSVNEITLPSKHCKIFKSSKKVKAKDMSMQRGKLILHYATIRKHFII